MKSIILSVKNFEERRTTVSIDPFIIHMIVSKRIALADTPLKSVNRARDCTKKIIEELKSELEDHYDVNSEVARHLLINKLVPPNAVKRSELLKDAMVYCELNQLEIDGV